MTGYKAFVVFNPRSAGGATARRWTEIEPALQKALGTYEQAPTQGPGHASVLTREALKAGFEMIVAIGGDGTFHEVVNGFYDGENPIVPNPVLGLVPAGTGGDYRRTWGLTTDPVEAISRLSGLAATPTDLGRIRWTEPDGSAAFRYFVNIASFGLSAEVSRRVNASSKRLGGRMSFFLASLGAMGSHTRRPVTLLTDGDSVKSVSLNFGAVALGQYCGGGMRMAPKAETGDGLFDIVTVSDCSRLKLAAMLDIYKGKHITRPEVATWRGQVVDATCESPEGCFIEADGEVFGQLPARFEILKSACRVKVAG